MPPEPAWARFERRNRRVRWTWRQMLWVRWLAAFLAFMTVPGVQEGIEDLVHLIRDGHTAHDPGHEDENPDHCCSGLFHVCTCHPHASATRAEPCDPLGGSRTERLAALLYMDRGAAPGYGLAPFRPPAA